MLDDLEFKNNRDYFLGIQKKDICISQVGRSKDISLVFVRRSVEDLEKNDSEDNKIKDIENNLK